MDVIYPQKLQAGDEVRVIAPARSLAIISEESRTIADKRFAELELKLSFGQHVDEVDDFSSSSIASRLDDLHEAFADPHVKGILTAIGGFNSNQLLREINWELIRNNPKVLCGFSDITALSNAVLAKSGLVTYSGPHYSSFGMERHFGYTLDYFKKCIMQDESINVTPSSVWTDDRWFAGQNNRVMMPNTGWLVINEGQASGSIRGGNLSTLCLLEGTDYMPDLSDTIMFIEDDEESQPHHFDRQLTSLIQQPGFAGVKGLVVGRFQKASNMTADLLGQIIASKKELAELPVLANVGFGHTSPIITYPIGGQASLTADAHTSSLRITAH